MGTVSYSITTNKNTYLCICFSMCPIYSPREIQNTLTKVRKLFTAPKQSTHKACRFWRGNIRIRSIILAGFLLYTMFEKQAYKAFSGTRSLLMRNLEVNKLARHRKEWSLIKNDQCIWLKVHQGSQLLRRRRSQKIAEVLEMIESIDFCQKGYDISTRKRSNRMLIFKLISKSLKGIHKKFAALPKTIEPFP